MTALVIKAHQSQVNFEVFLASMLLKWNLRWKQWGSGSFQRVYISTGRYLDSRWLNIFK